MPIVLFFLLLSPVFANEPCNSVKVNLIETEKQCFSLVCNINNENPFLMDPDELLKVVRNEPISDSVKNIAQRLEGELLKRKKTQELVKKLIAEDKVSEMADQIIKDPKAGLEILQYVFHDKLKLLCDDQNGRTCKLMQNDSYKITDNFKKFYETIHELDFVSTEIKSGYSLDKKIFLANLLARTKDYYPEIDFIKEKNKILSLSEKDFALYLNSSWIQEYKRQNHETLKAYQKDLTAMLMETLVSAAGIDFSKERERVIDSCKLTSYLEKDIKTKATPEKFKELQQQVIDSIKKNFLSKLSSSSAKKIEAVLKSKPFHLTKVSMNPAPESLVSLDDPKNNLDILKNINRLYLSKDNFCHFKYFSPIDKFDPNKKDYIETSEFTTAYGGMDVMLHEFGHWLSRQMVESKLSVETLMKLQTVRRCITSFYSQHNIDMKNTEEDFADWFASQAGSRDLKNSICEINKMLKMADASKESSYRPEVNQDHSNELFRILQMRINGGIPIPKICQDLIDAYPDFSPKRCEYK